jgi:hypothetical protein
LACPPLLSLSTLWQMRFRVTNKETGDREPNNVTIIQTIQEGAFSVPFLEPSSVWGFLPVGPAKNNF